MHRLLYVFLALASIAPGCLHARPVSYTGGWTLMLMNDANQNSAHMHYSPTAKLSIGYKAEHWRELDAVLNAVQLNSLLKRWNKPESQANIYFKSALGSAHINADNVDESSNFSGFLGFSTDWENRRYFTSYANRYTKFGNHFDFFQQSARIGWAPYEGDYGDLHTWLMLQIIHMPEAEHNVTIMPLVRLFKGVHMYETGFSQRGELLFNYIFRH